MTQRANMPEDAWEEKDFDQASDLTKGRQRWMRRPKRPADILSQLMARKGYCQITSTSEIEDVWSAIVGEKWKDKTRAGNVSRGVLEVFVSSPAVNQRLGFQIKKLVAQINERMPNNKITNIKFRVGSVDPR